MKRIIVCDENGNYQGWFNLNKVTDVASYKQGDPYTYGKILYVTAQGKLIVNDWNNSGRDVYRFATDEAEIAEILSRGGYADDDKKLIGILTQYEL